MVVLSVLRAQLGMPPRRYLDLLRVLTERYVKVRYRGSFLGVYWSLLNPCIMTAIYTLILGHTFARYYNNSIVDYLESCFVGLVVINFFSTSTGHALPSVVSNSGLLNKIKLPPSLFPMSLMSASTFQLAVGVFPVLAIITLVTSKSLLNVLLLVVPVFALVLVSCGTALIVSMLYVFFRDIPYMYELLTFAFWVATPVFYPISIVDERYRFYLQLNPLTPIIQCIRELTLSARLPNLEIMAQGLLMGIFVALFGWFAFRNRSALFMDYL
ncbi:MAG: ABC transporter permease [Candidatus Eremiobacteraeota bacterium]|nr:ABC transporter permease [Candidatus Eremiobacteraeota bacterium]